MKHNQTAFLPQKTNIAFIIKLILVLAMLIAWVMMSVNPKVMFVNKAVQLWVHAPNYVDTEEEFEITVQAWDWSERLAKSYKNTVGFEIVSYRLDDYELLNSASYTIPSPTKFLGAKINLGGISPELVSKEVGKMSFPVTIATEGIHYILAKDDKGLSAVSNPIVAVDGNTKALLWGDIHTHSALSDGSGLPNTIMKYARDSALLDFYALTDHGEGFGITTTERAKWQVNHNYKKTEEYNAPGEFVTFHGIEWTTSFGMIGKEFGYGHYTIVSDADAPVLAARGKQESTNELWQYLDEYCAENNAKVIALPHHLTQTNFEMDWFGMNPEYVKTVCAFSVHGADLLPSNDPLNYLGTVHAHDAPLPGASIVDALRMGYKVAIVANSDSHDGNPGHALCHKAAHYPNQYPVFGWFARGGHAYAGGLTGAYIDKSDFDRKGIMDSIRNGSVVATRAPFRPVIDFSVNGLRPGQDESTLYVPQRTTERNIQVQVLRDGLELGWDGKGNINDWQDLTVEVWKNSELWYTQKSNAPIVNLSLTDNTEITGAVYDDYYYNESTGKYYQNEKSLVGKDSPDGLHSGGQDYYFIRVYQGEGSPNDFYSWVGPIWVGVNG